MCTREDRCGFAKPFHSRLSTRCTTNFRRTMSIMRTVLGLSVLALASAAQKPNIVFFMADGALKTSSFTPALSSNYPSSPHSVVLHYPPRRNPPYNYPSIYPSYYCPPLLAPPKISGGTTSSKRSRGRERDKEREIERETAV